jgi:nucleotide-binding universal stress UspA family protein
MKTILVPIDFSDNSLVAAQFAIQYAQSFNAKVFFLHTYHNKVLVNKSQSQQNDSKELARQDLEISFKKHIQDQFDQLNIAFDENQCKLLLKESVFIIECILETIESYGVELVIMGTKGSSGLQKMFFGSNTTGVIEKSTCPVLSIPLQFKQPSFKEIDSIACATELNNARNEVSQFISLVRLFDADLNLFHIYPTFPKIVDVEKLDNKRFVDDLREEFNYSKINLHFVNTRKDNDVTFGIDSYIKSYKPKMLVVFTQERSWFDKVFNPSAAKEVVSNVQIPILTFKVKS